MIEWFMGLPNYIKIGFWIIILLKLFKWFLKAIFIHKEFTLAAFWITLYIIIMIMLVKSTGMLSSDVMIL